MRPWLFYAVMLGVNVGLAAMFVAACVSKFCK